MSASKLDGPSNADGGQGNKPGSLKGPARALPVSQQKSRGDKRPGIPQELQAGLALPDPAERRKILEQAGVLIAQARELLDRLDQTDKQTAMISTEKPKAKSARSTDAEH